MKIQTLREKLRETTLTAIIEAAERVMSKEGFDHASLQTIADEAGVAVGTIYNYFRDKEGLIAATFTRRREEMFEAIDAAAKIQSAEPFTVQLTGYVQAVFAHFDARRDFLRIALESDKVRPSIIKGDDGRKRPAMQQLKERADRVVRVGIREKALREDEGNLFSTVLVAIIKGVLIERSLEEKPLTAETARVVQLFLKGTAR